MAHECAGQLPCVVGPSFRWVAISVACADGAQEAGGGEPHGPVDDVGDSDEDWVAVDGVCREVAALMVERCESRGAEDLVDGDEDAAEVGHARQVIEGNRRKYTQHLHREVEECAENFGVCFVPLVSDVGVGFRRECAPGQW